MALCLLKEHQHGRRTDMAPPDRLGCPPYNLDRAPPAITPPTSDGEEFMRKESGAERLAERLRRGDALNARERVAHDAWFEGGRREAFRTYRHVRGSRPWNWQIVRGPEGHDLYRSASFFDFATVALDGVAGWREHEEGECAKEKEDALRAAAAARPGVQHPRTDPLLEALSTSNVMCPHCFGQKMRVELRKIARSDEKDAILATCPKCRLQTLNGTII
jgi:DNA-directed RNA polymerase subunit M/transcription elongation factor TFIIS